MSPQQRWRRIQTLSEQAEALPPADRDVFLATTEPDAQLRLEVLSLLEALGDEERMRLEMTVTASEPAPLPESIAGYRVTGLLGRGGTSTVYEALREVDGVSSNVAVKMLHGYLLDEESTRRFQREHRILAQLNHPALCRVLDAGVTADRQPFLVMEKVDGKPITEYADEHRLTLAHRITLVARAADAIAAVHRNFVAHLDLKPSNLFVTRDGHVKLLDFGTAKLLNPLGDLTATRQLTPNYASPEQLRGDPVTMASDIYSLGLILYEVLAGTSPNADASLVSIAERAAGLSATPLMAGLVDDQAATHRGVSPTRLRDLLRGDISRIVAKSLAPEPDRRYPSIADFAADLRRYLDNRPVLARSQTMSYRLRKYAARNRGSLVLTMALLMAVIAAAGYSLWQQRQALEAGRRAQASANFLSWLITSSNPLFGGRPDMTVLELAQRAELWLSRGDLQDADLTVSTQAMLGSFQFNAGNEARGAASINKALEQALRSANRDNIAAISGLLSSTLLNKGDCAAAVKVMQQADARLALPGPALTNSVQVSYWVNRDQVKWACEQDLSGQLTARAVALLPTIPDTSTALNMPPRLWKALVYNGSGRAFIVQKKNAESRAAVEQGLRLAALEPDGKNIRIALLQTRASAEYNEKNVVAAANSLDEAATLAESSAAPFEAIRLKVMAGQRLAEAGNRERALLLADQAVAQAKLHEKELTQSKWMILVDAAATYFRAGHCEKVGPLVREADELTGGRMPPQWRGNRLAVETMCLAEAGNKAEAQALGARALAAAGSTWSNSSTMRKKIEAIVAGR